jgi:hypothetical protein
MSFTTGKVLLEESNGKHESRKVKERRRIRRIKKTGGERRNKVRSRRKAMENTKAGKSKNAEG